MSKLFEDPITCVMRADCPYALRTPSDAMTLDDYLTLPHVAPTQLMPGYLGVIDDFLDRQGLQRNVVVESAYFGLIPNMLAQTDLVLTTGRQFVRQYEKQMPLKTYALPVKFPAMRFYQLWHERVHQAPEHKWLREQVAAAAKGLTLK
jgi:DNA-binding transcriptional LysR family regulator